MAQALQDYSFSFLCKTAKACCFCWGCDFRRRWWLLLVQKEPRRDGGPVGVRSLGAVGRSQLVRKWPKVCMRLWSGFFSEVTGLASGRGRQVVVRASGHHRFEAVEASVDHVAWPLKKRWVVVIKLRSCQAYRYYQQISSRRYGSEEAC